MGVAALVGRPEGTMTPNYDRLATLLSETALRSDDVTLGFQDISRILGFPLPDSAFRYRQWWANQHDTSGRPQARNFFGAAGPGDFLAPPARARPGAETATRQGGLVAVNGTRCVHCGPPPSTQRGFTDSDERVVASL